MSEETHLDPSYIPSSIRPQVVPVLRLPRVVDATTRLEVLERTREELEIGEDEGVDLYLVAQLDVDELGLGVTGSEHVAVLLLDEDGRSAFALTGRAVDHRGALEGSVVRAVLEVNEGVGGLASAGVRNRLDG
jgi:hypothetical protein